MSTETLDAELFAALRQAIDSVEDTEAIRKLTVPFQNEYARFVTDQVENPYFKAKASSVNITQATAAIGDCERALSDASAPEVVVQLYRAKLENQQTRFNLLTAAIDGDDTAFRDFSIELYGKPKRRLFAMVVRHVLGLQPGTKKGEQAHALLTEALAHVTYDGEPLPLDILPPLQREESEALSAVEVKEVFDETIEAEELDGWQSVIDTTGDRAHFSVQPQSKIVHIPSDEQLSRRGRPLTKIATEAIAGHEIGVHAKRAHNGARSPLKLLELGLDSYLRGEEGLASYVQQQIEGAEQFYGLDRYLALGLALGLDGEERDFRAVFIVMKAYYRLVAGEQKISEKKVIEQAWDVCRRIFRGTTGQSAGCVYTKDLVYFEGNLAMWDFVVQHAEHYDSLFVGKFDPLNKRHVTSLQTLNILPEW